MERKWLKYFFRSSCSVVFCWYSPTLLCVCVCVLYCITATWAVYKPVPVVKWLTAFRPGRLMRCIRCPSAYHTGDSCVAAGSVALTHHIMICSSHGSAKRNGLLTSPVNVGWCFLCARGKLPLAHGLPLRPRSGSDPEMTEHKNAEVRNFLHFCRFSFNWRLTWVFLTCTSHLSIILHVCSFFYI